MFETFDPEADKKYIAPLVGRSGTKLTAHILGYDADKRELRLELYRPANNDLEPVMKAMGWLAESEELHDQVLGEGEVIYDADGLPCCIKYYTDRNMMGSETYEEVDITDVVRDEDGGILQLRSKVYAKDWKGECITTRHTYVLPPEQTGLDFYVLASVRNEEVIHAKVSGMDSGTYLDVYAVELGDRNDLILQFFDGRSLGFWPNARYSLVEPLNQSTDLIVTNSQNTHTIEYSGGQIGLQVVSENDIVICDTDAVTAPPPLQIKIPEADNEARTAEGLQPLALPDVTLPPEAYAFIEENRSNPDALLWKGWISFADNTEVTLTIKYDSQRQRMNYIQMETLDSETTGSQVETHANYYGGNLVGIETSWCDFKRSNPDPDNPGGTQITNVSTARTTVIELEDRVILVTLAQDGSQRFEPDAEVQLESVRTIRKDPELPADFVLSTDGQTVTLEPDWVPEFDHMDVEQQLDIPLDAGHGNFIYFPDERRALEVMRRGLQVVAI